MRPPHARVAQVAPLDSAIWVGILDFAYHRDINGLPELAQAPFRHFAKVVLPGGEGWAFMWIAYFDDSGTHSDSDVVLWNGVFGHKHQWDYFDRLWAAKLQAPSPAMDALKRFHMFDCQAHTGEFLRWSRVATDFLVHELVDIILQVGLYSDGAAISRKDWDDLVTGDLRTALGDAEGYSLRMAFVRASKWARSMGSKDLAFVFDRRPEREKEGKRVFQLFEHFAKIETDAVAPVSITFADSHRILPLQAADLIAWHQYQYAIEYLKSGGRTKAASSRELQRLSKGGRVNIGIGLRSAIEKMVALEAGNKEKIGRAAELLTVSDDEFAERFNAPLPASAGQSSKT